LGNAKSTLTYLDGENWSIGDKSTLWNIFGGSFAVVLGIKNSEGERPSVEVREANIETTEWREKTKNRPVATQIYRLCRLAPTQIYKPRRPATRLNLSAG
jgi:hypothetical protein